MKKDGTGTWKKVKMLPQGNHEYKFIVDGLWRLDPKRNKRVPNPYGTNNSVMDVKVKR
jgi:hypothetical protein